MEDDDEFGDLYTDVLQPFQSSSSTPAIQPPPAPVPEIEPPVSRGIDLNDKIPSDDEEILYGVDRNQLKMNLNKIDQPRVLMNLDLNLLDNNNNNINNNNIDNNNNNSNSNIDEENKDENFGIEEADVDGNEFLIPGLSTSANPDLSVTERGGGGGGGEEWEDSDSEDDLQIVLNDDNGMGMMGMDGGIGVGVGGGMGGDDDDDEDGDGLVIVTGNGDQSLQQMEEMENWGEEGGLGGGEEKKDVTGGGGGGDAVAMKVGYPGHGYHSFHSQFKYVRPGAAPMPGAGPVAPGGQIRPPPNMAPFAGRGRPEWRPPGVKNVPPNMQKNFHPGYGMQAWGNNGTGRAFGSGLDFTLPSHKTIFEVDIDGFEEKPWRLQGIDVSDFFNFGMNEESWKEFCKQLEQHRMEATMQSKIRVYESGRTEQEYDPDLPPELAAAAGHDIISENRNIGKMDVQSDLAKGSARARMQLPTGKAIQVETGFGERLPSIDTRPPRMRDSDAIIEIVLQRSPSPENESIAEDAGAEHLEDVPLKENHREGLEVEDEIRSEDDRFEKPQAYNGSKREGSGRRTFVGATSAVGDRVPHLSETEVEDHINSRVRKHNSPRNNIERRMKRTAADRSPRLTNQNEESTESVDHKQSPSSPRTLGSAEERSFDQTDAMKEDIVVADGNTNFKDEKSKHTMKKQKLTRTAHSSVERGEEREDSKAGRSSENSRDMEQDGIQSRDLIHNVNIRKPVTRGRDEKHERERHQMAMKGTWDMNQEYRAHVKSDNFDRKKGRESERVWQDEERMRIEEMKKRQKGRENERSDKNEHRVRKAMENGGWKGEFDRDRDMIPHVKRDDSLKTRHNISDGIHSKRETTIRESTSRRKRERDDSLDQYKRDEQARPLRDDEQLSFRYKEEARLQREKVERQRERDEWKERDGHKGGHSRLKEDYRSSDKEYPFKETVREQPSRRDKFENENVSRHRGREDGYAHGNKVNNEERIARHESRYTVAAKDMHGVHEKKHKESQRKGKETDGAFHNSVATSRRNREDHIGQRSERASSRGMIEQRTSDQNPVSRRSSKKHKENASSEDEQQESKKGRSKLERWTSHKDRDFNLAIKAPSASLDPKDNGPPTKLPEETSKPQEIIEDSKPLVEEKTEDAKPAEDKHLDTVEKLKKRSERFKLPMPSEKESFTIKKIENEPLPPTQPETQPESEVKPERPARKRRWTSG